MNAETMATDLPIVLSKILDSYGLDDDSRKRRMDCQKITQLLMSWNNDLFWSDGFGDILLSGSSYETTTINGLSSDVDMMYILKNMRVIDNIRHWRHDTSIYTYLMERCGSHKAFAKICLLSQNYPGLVYSDTIRYLPKGHTIGIDNEILLENNSRNIILDKSLEQHGPALTEKRLAVECDNVISIKCDFFPSVANGWKERQTSGTRTGISNTIIDQATHCYLVGVGNKGSPTENVEWRLSFSHIENNLVHAWNNIQYKSYVMMKFIKKELIEPSAPGIICSYHFKTILMWMNEEYGSDFFVVSNFDKCLLTCLNKLLSATKNKTLPHYFIEGCNLFHGKMDIELTQVCSVLEQLLSVWPQCLFKIKCRRFGVTLQSCHSGRIPLRELCERTFNEDRTGGYFGVKQERNNVISCYILPNILPKTDEKYVFKSLFELKKQSNSIVWNYEKECKEFVDFLIKDSLCGFGFALLGQSGNMPNKKALCHRRAGYGCIQRYIHDCLSTTCLEAAGHFVIVGDLQTALTLLVRAEEQMKYLTSAPRVNINKITIKEQCKFYYGGSIQYTMANINQVPGVLAYELFHNTLVSPPLQLLLNDNYAFYYHKSRGEFVIPSEILLYYFQFHCFHALGRFSHRQVALDNIEWILQLYSKKQWFGEYIYNIIGDCHRTCGEDRKAYWNYRKSLEKQKHHNAVMWYFAVLLRRKIRDR